MDLFMNKYVGLSVIIFVSISVYDRAIATLMTTTAQDGQVVAQFPIESFVASNAGNKVYMAMREGCGPYTLSRVNEHGTSIDPYAPEIVNHKRNAAMIEFVQGTNPLFNQSILHLGLMQEVSGILSGTVHPVVVTRAEPSLVHLTGRYQGSTAVLSTAIADAHQENPNLTSGIVGLGASNEFVFAAVKPHSQGDFGIPGSGIAYCILGTRAVEKEEKDDEDTQKEDSLTKTVVAIFAQIDAFNGLNHAGIPRALPLDCTTPQILLGTAERATRIGQKAVFEWNKQLRCLYVGVSVEGTSDKDGGVQGIMVMHATQDKGLSMCSLAPKNLFNASTKTPIGAYGPNASIAVHQLGTMYTSTALSYLILLGGTTAAAHTKHAVYAIPLVKSSDQQVNGTLAKKTASSCNYFATDVLTKGNFLSRGLQEVATTADDLVQEHDAALCIGGGKMVHGAITSMHVAGDVVFVTVTDEYSGVSGVYSSRALFNQDGAIAGWTSWQHAHASTQSVMGIVPDMQQGTTLSLLKESSGAVSVHRSDWSSREDEKQTLATLISKEFKSDAGGIIAVHDFAYTTPGLDMSLLVTTGFKRIMLIQTGKRSSTGDAPIKYQDTDYQTMYCTKGAIEQKIEMPLIVFSGGIIDEIGAVTSVAIATNEKNMAWLVVAGVHGAAILSTESGQGWNVHEGLGNNFAGFIPGMSFKKLGSFKLVKKLVADGPYIYMLTGTQLCRIDTRVGAIGSGQVVTTVLAEADTAHHEGFLDVIVSGKWALLATNKGLLRIGNKGDISTATNAQECKWISVVIPENIGSVSQLQVISATGMPTDIARAGGMIYALNANRATRQAHLVRFAVKGMRADDTIDDQTIQPIADMFSENALSYFINFSCFRSKLITDGVRYIFGNSIDIPQPCDIALLAGLPPVCTGQRLLIRSSQPVKSSFTVSDQLNTLGIISATGECFAAGSFGIIIH
jgi:hypothetical protein